MNNVSQNTGGARRDKAGRKPARISPRHLPPGVSGTTGTLFAAILLVAISPASLAADSTVTAAPDAAAATSPKQWPGPVQLLSPSASLNRKSQVAIDKVRKWQAKNFMPAMQRGEVVFVYGATQDTVVGAPLHISDIALQPGEIVQNVNLGDVTNWSCPPAISGTGSDEVTHLMCRPNDAGLETNLAIQTSRRTYSIELKSTQRNYMPRVKWSYPEDQVAQWNAYQQHGGRSHTTLPIGGPIQYTINGDSPPWRPVAAFSDGQKTYIRFPPSMAYGKAPVLEQLP